MKQQMLNEDLKLQSNKRKKKKKKFIRILKIIRFFLLLGIIVTAIVFTALSPLFNINKIEVSGSKHYNKELLTGLTNINIGENGFKILGSSLANIFNFRYGKAERNIRQKCPYVKEAIVRFAIPSTVEVKIVERTAWAIIPYSGTSLIIDDEGYVLETYSSNKKLKLLIIKGLEFKNYSLGSKLVVKDTEIIKNAAILIDAIRLNDKNDSMKLFEKVDSIDVKDSQNVLISLDSRIIVNIGDLVDLNYKLSSTKIIFFKNIKTTERGKLDFTIGQNPIFSPENKGGN